MHIPDASTEPVWLHVGTLLDGSSSQPRRDAHIVYNARTILFVGSEGSTPPRELLRPGQRAPDASAPEATLLPGLIEAHAHLFLEGGELDPDVRATYLKRSPDELLTAAKERLPKLVRLGLAAIRDAGDKDGVGLALAKHYATARTSAAETAMTRTTAAGVVEHRSPAARVAGGHSLLPYVDSPGAAIHHAGRYGSFMAEPLENNPSAQAAVEARVAAGAARIKLIPTGIINFKRGAVTTAPQMTLAEVAALVAAAKAFGRQTFAHASGDTGIDLAIEGGVDSIEHGYFIRDDQLAKLRDRRIAWVPTFAPVQEQVDHADRMGWDASVVDNLRRILDQHASSLVKAHEMGVLIIAGSDAGSYGVPHGLGLLRELELMERAGLPPLAVINAATGTSSSRLGFQEPFGRIAPGHASRFILALHSPLATVTNLRRARHVIFDGEVLHTDETADTANL